MSDVTLPRRDRMDRIGMVLSGACIIHCLASPVVAVGAAAAGIRLGEDGVHSGLAFVVAAVGLFAFVPGYRRHQRFRVLVAAGLGIALLWAPALAGNGWGSTAEPLLVTAGGLLLIRAHRWNRSFCAGCTRCTPASLDLSTRARCSLARRRSGASGAERHAASPS